MPSPLTVICEDNQLSSLLALFVVLHLSMTKHGFFCTSRFPSKHLKHHVLNTLTVLISILKDNNFSYSLVSQPQLCGFRGGGNSAAKSLFWQPRKGQSFILVFDSERERNGALVLARKHALECNVSITAFCLSIFSFLCSQQQTKGYWFL